MNWLDLIVIVLVAWGLITGLRKGLVMQVATLIGLFLAIIATRFCSGIIAQYIRQFFEIPTELLPAISIIFCFLGIVIVCNFIAHIIHSLMHQIELGWLDHLVGGIVGSVKNLLMIGFLLSVVIENDKYNVIVSKEQQEKSVILKPVTEVTSIVLAWVDWEKTINEIQKQIENVVVPLSGKNTTV